MARRIVRGRSAGLTGATGGDALGRAIVARRRIGASRFAELMEAGELHSRIIRDIAEIDTILATLYRTSDDVLALTRKAVLAD